MDDPELPRNKAELRPSLVKQTLIDPRTYHVVGRRRFVDGKVAGTDELVTTAVVDKAGECS
ncbi:hypothetical protein AB0D38_23600 [Streptomyces sp. NPDC048279]|uniref:hypothetical protein n=1 Tax=Streptomyces sp. NPDC048279 TaxID=3154714 RepID=UPI0034223070